MSEFLHFQINFTDPKGEQGTFDCTPDNTELYYHSAEFADVDHFFHRYDPRDRKIGSYVWRHILGNEAFNALGNQMITSHNWIVHYYPTPTDYDFEQFAADFTQIPDELPDDFS